jgi:hypothetical protein
MHLLPQVAAGERVNAGNSPGIHGILHVTATMWRAVIIP